MAVSKLKQLKLGESKPTLPSESMAGWIDRYVLYLRRECHLAENTVEAYSRDLEHFSTWLEGRSPTRMTIVELGDFLGFLRGIGLAPSSISRHVVAVRMFFKFLQLESAIAENPAELLATQKMWQRIPKVMTPGTIERFLNAPKRWDALYLRDRAILELMYATGCRVSEVADMRLNNLHLEESYAIAEGKGSKQRVVPLGVRAIEALKDYLGELRPKLAKGRDTLSAPWVILSRTGRRMRREAIWELVKKSALRAGVDPNVTPHTLRHSFATHLLSGGADLRMIQEMLGHATIQTTQIYTQVDASRLKKVHQAFHPRA